MTLVDTTNIEDARHTRNWQEAYRLIPTTHLYEGILEVFDEIRNKGVKAAIVSTSPRPYVERLVAYYHMPISAIVAYHDAWPIKPNPAPMRKALELLGEQPDNVISFGDRAIDITASNGALIPSVACTWGTKEHQLLIHSGYTHIISNPREILNFLK